MELLVVLLVLLAATRIFGELAVRLGQPALVGELISGILIGLVVNRFPDTFPALVGLADDEVFQGITDLGVFFLMLLAGIGMRPREMTQGSKRSTLVALGGLLLPMALGFGLGWWLLPESSFKLAQALFLGTALAITAVPVAVKILIDLDALYTKIGQTIVAAAVLDDVLSLIVLAVLTAIIQTGDLPGVADFGLLLGQIALFFAITTFMGAYLLPRLEPYTKRWLGDEFAFSILVLIAFAFAVLAEILQMHFIIGAFVAGLFFARRTMPDEVHDHVNQQVSGLTMGLLAPIFFASIGLHLDLSALTAVPWFVGGLIAIAIIGKVVGAGLPARLAGMSNRDSLAVGSAMTARGAVELIIAQIALAAGLFSRPEPTPPIVQHMFSAVVIMAIVTTLLTPIGLRLLLRPAPGDDPNEVSRVPCGSGGRSEGVDDVANDRPQCPPFYGTAGLHAA